MIPKRWRLPTLIIFSLVCLLLLTPRDYLPSQNYFQWQSSTTENAKDDLPSNRIQHGSFWAKLPIHYPVKSIKPIPPPRPELIPPIQARFGAESSQARIIRLQRLEAVKSNFTHAWTGYKKHAWLHDEVQPISGKAHDPFGGWAATLVDSLDTLWMMDMKDEFKLAVETIDQIDFSQCSLQELNVFETTIRYLGGFLAAYDLSHGEYPSLLQKTVELGDMLYKAFDTPNRMPITRWDFRKAASGERQEASDWMLVAELGSLSLEFTRLSQITGDSKWYDAVQRIADHLQEQQPRTRLPGMWPVVVNAKAIDFASDGGFTIGGMADSTYEYLPKQHLLMAAGTSQFEDLYQSALKAMKSNIFYRAMTSDNTNIMFAGKTFLGAGQDPRTATIEAEAQHLGCFAGGMVGLGAKLFHQPADLELAHRLVDGCLWAYENMPNGMMPEIMHFAACDDATSCAWDESKWLEAVARAHEDSSDNVQDIVARERLPKGVAKVNDRRYILRPEAIESAFILYRITGDQSLPDRAWKMFESIVSKTKTNIAHAALGDCVSETPRQDDRMESFWMAETLKYFYLIFSEPDHVSLDNYVFNTEAHPLRRPR